MDGMTPLSAPRISVVVPTRDRCDTLVASLRTCLDQDYEHCEIIVSDNLSNDGTKEHVTAIRDPRVRYVRTEWRLGMSQNWEFALSHVTGDYVTFVGDDDALLPGALKELSEIIHQTGTHAVTWRAAAYVWPNSIHELSRNLLFIPRKGRLERRATPRYLQQVLDFQRGYSELPVIYKGIAKTDVMRQIASLSRGRFFQSLNPDLYSAIALSLVLPEYYYSATPFSINGTSAHSNSASQLSPSLGDLAAKTFMAEDNIPFHKDLEFAASMSLAVAESFFQARDRLAQALQFSLDVKRLLQAMIEEMATSERPIYEQSAAAVRSIASRHGLAKWAESRIAATSHRAKPAPIALIPGYNIARRMHIVDCAKLGINDIHQAAAVCKTVLEVSKLGFVQHPLAVVATTFVLARGLACRWYERWNASVANRLKQHKINKPERQ